VRELKNDGRSAVTDYLDLIEGSSDQTNRPIKLSHPIHPSIKRAYDMLLPWFEGWLIGEEGQQLLFDPTRMEEIYDMAPSSETEVKRDIMKRWDNPSLSPQDRWDYFVQRTTPPSSSSNNRSQMRNSSSNNSSFGQLEIWRMEVVLKYTYPRIDANVSKTMNHLLKSPFCVHPKTGCVCIPISKTNFSTFNPLCDVPTLSSLCQELDDQNTTNQGESKKEEEEEDENRDLKSTSLYQSVIEFEQEFLVPLGRRIKREFRERREEMDGVMGEF